MRHQLLLLRSSPAEREHTQHTHARTHEPWRPLPFAARGGPRSRRRRRCGRFQWQSRRLPRCSSPARRPSTSPESRRRTFRWYAEARRRGDLAICSFRAGGMRLGKEARRWKTKKNDDVDDSSVYRGAPSTTTSSFSLLPRLFPSPPSFATPTTTIHQQGDPIPVKVNKLASVKTQLPFDFYSLPFCRPDKIVPSAENLGEVLRGDRIKNSGYEVAFKVDQACKVLCVKGPLTAEEAEQFSKAVSFFFGWGMRGCERR